MNVVGAKPLLMVIFVWVLTLAKNSGVDGYGQLFPKGVTVVSTAVETDSTEEDADSSGSHWLGHSHRNEVIMIWISICLWSATLVALATLIGYSVLPELKNLQERMVHGYLFSYFSFIISLTAFMMTFWHDILESFYITIVAILYYFGVACLLWLTMMSFDIWRRFRMLRPCQEAGVEKRERTTFVYYSICVWGTAVVLALILPACFVFDPQFDFAFSQLVVLLTIAVPCFCNTCFNISTALKIEQYNRQTTQMVDGVNEQYQKSKQWFNLYKKLTTVMECPLILWGVGYAWSNYISALLFFSTVPLQAIYVFYMFVWSDNVKRSIRKRFAGMMDFGRQRDSVPIIENENA